MIIKLMVTLNCLWGMNTVKRKKGLSPIVSELSRGRSQRKRLRSSKELGMRQRDRGLTRPKEEKVSNRVIGDEC